METRRLRAWPIIFITILVIALAPALLWIRSNQPLALELFEREIYNREISYQLTVLVLVVALIGIVYALTGREGLAYLSLRRRDGQIRPEPWIGIKPKPAETWKNLGLNFAVVITLVTAIVIYFQVIHGRSVQLELFPGMGLVILFALINAFSEEIIFRFSFVAVVNKFGYSPYLAQGLAAVTFGGIHYFGTPSGIPGVLMAAFIGWLLAKSMNETRGFFWALVIHFLQDVVIFTALFMG
ncbi:CPBP family intramembrane glutamic endopeptidase [Paenibacillus sp. YPG26]|uniref:CPBP family intramembrane glutamic endopeptidase n=1 Tax=Paenibacillus sp. YPG26 TaxID=2878915 RepID=UPI00204110F0|nr:CPBP family intramembrane glutamic endopeptidase [Paenibacillus sp. YPG26]USB33928.1 CPBP family intramembrane metalloprotease [Paenibacillus sp. YPG26]